MHKAKIQEASREDRDTIYEMICLLEEEKLDKASFDHIFESNRNNPDVSYITAVREDRIIGFASLHIQLLLHHSGAVAEIQELIIMPEARGKGIGAALIQRLKQIAREKNCLAIEVSCNLKRKQTHQFYLKQKMEQTHYKFVETIPGKSHPHRSA